MTENEFLISRALNVFNAQYRRNIKVEHCAIVSMEPDVQSDRAYEITTPNHSEFFRIRLYLKFGRLDLDSVAVLEVTMPYLEGELGDEVYVIMSQLSAYWRTVYKFDDTPGGTAPNGAIVTEDDIPIVTEYGRFIIKEAA